MRLTLVRHATLVLDIAGLRLIVDPMLDPAGARPPIPGTPAPRPNPLVDLPRPAEEVLAGVDAAIVTHLHQDHVDATALALLLAGGMPVACQPADAHTLAGAGLAALRPMAGTIELGPVSAAPTPGRHGHGALGESLGPVSGVVLRAPGEPVVYLAGDTVWYEEVERTLATQEPDVVVVNAGGARFVEGAAITMDADDVVDTARATDALVVAVHMEAINHCLLTRAALRERLAAEGLAKRVLVPEDGASLELTLPAR